jgi:hypothetical protein
MSSDIRVNLGFFDHPKVIALETACGEVAPLRLIQLWARVAVSRHKGNLDGLAPRRLEVMAGWEGEPGALFKALTTCLVEGLGPLIDVDARGNALSIHDWPFHQSYVSTKDVRTEIAKKAADARWTGKKQGSHAHSIARSNAKGKARSNARSNAERNAPLPPPPPTGGGGADAPSPPLGAGRRGRSPADPYAPALAPAVCSSCGVQSIALTEDEELCWRCVNQKN